MYLGYIAKGEQVLVKIRSELEKDAALQEKNNFAVLELKGQLLLMKGQYS